MFLFIETGSHAVKFGRENGDDFNEVESELFDGSFCETFFQNGDFDTEGSADKKDQLATEPK